MAADDVAAFLFKEESTIEGHRVGPVWIRDRAGKLRPYAVSPGTGATMWLRFGEAAALAESYGVPLEDV